MDKFEKIVQEVPADIIVDDQANLKPTIKGFYTNESGIDLILINKGASPTEKLCILAEELGHYYTTSGDITDQADVKNRKQEKKARRWAVERLICLDDLIDGFEKGVGNKHELAEHLGVTEEFLHTALAHFKSIYGYSYRQGEYSIVFDPLWISKRIE